MPGNLLLMTHTEVTLQMKGPS